jgi:hypothetical protein
MSFDHILVARILFTLMTAGWAVATVFADFNKTHATNPKWTPHARFHVSGRFRAMSASACWPLR